MSVELTYLNCRFIGDTVFGLECNISGSCEVSLLGIVRTFVKVDGFNGFGLQEVQIGIALPVGM